MKFSPVACFSLNRVAGILSCPWLEELSESLGKTTTSELVLPTSWALKTIESDGIKTSLSIN